MPEEQELHLSVVLDDKASEQLEKLQQTLLSISNSASNTSAMNNFARGLGSASQHAQGLGSNLMGLAARGGFVGGFFFHVGTEVAKMAEEFVNAVVNIKEFSDEMVHLNESASGAATSMAQFHANVAVFRESGLSAEQATKSLTGYARAVADLQRPGSRIRQELLQQQKGESREQMMQLLRTVETGTQQEGMNALKKIGERIEQNWKEQGQPERGAAAKASFYTRMGMPGLENVRGEFREVSALERKMYDDRIRDAERFQVALAKGNQATQDIVRSLQAIAFEVLPINLVSETLAKWWEKVAKHAAEYEQTVRNAKKAAEQAAPGFKDLSWWQQRNPFNQDLIRAQEAANQWLHPKPNPLSDISESGEVYDVTGGAGARPRPPAVQSGRTMPRRAEPRRAEPPPADMLQFMNTLGGGQESAQQQGAANELQRAYDANISEMDDLTEEFRRLNEFFQIAKLAGVKPGSIFGTKPGRGGAPTGDSSSSSPDASGNSQSSTTDNTSTTASGQQPVNPSAVGPLSPEEALEKVPEQGLAPLTTQGIQEAVQGPQGLGPTSPGQAPEQVGPGGLKPFTTENIAQAVLGERGPGSTAAPAPGGTDSAATGASAATAGAGGANNAIAAERAQAMRELADPQTRQLAAWAVTHEQEGTAGRTDVLESLVNRHVAINMARKAAGKPPVSMNSLLTKGFYGPINEYKAAHGGAVPLAAPAWALKDFDTAAAAVGAGRNELGGRTDQGMQKEVKPEGRAAVRGEFYGWNAYGGKYEKQTAAARGDRSPAPAAAAAAAAPAAAATPAAASTVQPDQRGTAPGQNTTISGAILPSKLEAGAKQAALVGGSAGLKRFMQGNGYDMSDQWCGKHAAAILKSQGLTPPQNPELASNWRNLTKQGWSEVSDPKPGDIAVARPGWSGRGSGQTGDVGSHVTTVDQPVDKETGKFRSFGGNQGDPFRKFNANQFQFYRRPDGAQPTAAPPGGAMAAPPPNYFRTQLQEQLKQIATTDAMRDLVRQEVTKLVQSGNIVVPRGKLDEDLDKAAGKGVRPLSRGEDTKPDEELDTAAGKGIRRTRGEETKPDEELDIAAGKGRRLDAAANRRVDVTGNGKITVDVKNGGGVPIPKPRPSEALAKPVTISRQPSMAPAAPTGAAVHMEE